MQGLQMPEQKDTFKTALACVADISRGFEGKLFSYLKFAFDHLIQIMNSSSLDKQFRG